MNAAIADAASARVGALLVTDPEPVIADVEYMLGAPGGGAPARAGLVAGGIPILDRGEVVIIPLAWAPDVPAGSPEEQEMLQKGINELASRVDSSCGHRNPHRQRIQLPPFPDAPNRYADALVAAVVRRADWWWIGEYAVVLAVQGHPIPAPMTSLSLHIVRASTWTPRDVEPYVEGEVDLAWSWPDVVAAARTSEVDDH